MRRAIVAVVLVFAYVCWVGCGEEGGGDIGVPREYCGPIYQENPAITPDGVLYVRDNAVYCVMANGAYLEDIGSAGIIRYDTRANESVMYAVGGNYAYVGAGSTVVYSMGGTIVVATDGTGADSIVVDTPAYLVGPCISPDAAYVAWAEHLGGEDRDGIWIMNRRTGAQRRMYSYGG